MGQTDKKTLLELWQYRKDEFIAVLKRQGFTPTVMIIDGRLETTWSIEKVSRP